MRAAETIVEEALDDRGVERHHLSAGVAAVWASTRVANTRIGVLLNAQRLQHRQWQLRLG
jgi:hypothetical protein